MQKPNLKKITDQTSNGHPEQRLALAQQALTVLLNYLRWLSQNLKRQRDDFRRTLEAWEARFIHEELTPYAVQHDVEQGRKIRLYAWIAVLAELGMSFFMALSFGVPVLFALGLAVVATYVTKAMLMALWSNRLQPQETIRRLRQFIIAPFGCLTFVSLAVLLLAVRGTGGLLLLLAGLLNVSLFGVSFGLLFLAAGLLCYADVLLWSLRAERLYQRVYQEATATHKVYEHVQRVIAELASPVAAAPPPVVLPGQPNFVNASARPIKAAKPLVRVAAPFLLCVALFNSACKEQERNYLLPQTNTVTEALTPQSPTETEMQVFVDASFSNHPQMLEDAVQQLVLELAEIVEQQDVIEFIAYLFGQDGWSATKTVSLTLPARNAQRTSEAGALLPHLQEAQTSEAIKDYRVALRAKLQSLQATQLLPPTSAVEPPCTDLNGLFARLENSHSKRRRLIVVITDGHESCATAFRPVKLAPQTKLAVILLPEDPRNVAAQPQYTLFETRQQQLRQAIPSALILKPFEKIAEALRE